jgi:hypothetical protein
MAASDQSTAAGQRSRPVQRGCFNHTPYRPVNDILQLFCNVLFFHKDEAVAEHKEA